jgi:RNA polymerase sigma-70 factor (ECF subfamily)
MTSNKQAAEDITQETFVICYEQIDKFRGESHIFSWIYTVAKNKCLKYLEKQRKSNAEDLEYLVNNMCSPVDEKITKVEKQNYISQVKEGCLLGLLKTLSFNQRMAFILNVLYKIPIEDVANVLDKSVSATRTLVHRARKNIKDFLCNNCSAYDPNNKCKCENLINFSLKQGWIASNVNYPVDLPVKIKSELKEIEKISCLYNTLPEHEASKEINDRLGEFIKDKDFLVCSDKKVK